MTAEVGTDTAHTMPTLVDAMVGVRCEDMADDAKLHAAIIARRNYLREEARLLTGWARVVRQRRAADTSQRQAADELGVSRTAVRAGKAKQ
ncbi:hypothetical protein Rhe02_55110 [Rhizocola hellebori]|uniref:Uncharacterized protein n=1 Tax=Rhizocola hellebori TaxID=1392758 RepID=A0A8J3QCS9_9ACTN|nr:hypothetical protein [Rhizocola hellebori]GIH07444.1 hypothetical protein Rhe02_55110 [Rhizocola hellebori]